MGENGINTRKMRRLKNRLIPTDDVHPDLNPCGSGQLPPSSSPANSCRSAFCQNRIPPLPAADFHPDTICSGYVSYHGHKIGEHRKAGLTLTLSPRPCGVIRFRKLLNSKYFGTCRRGDAVIAKSYYSENYKSSMVYLISDTWLRGFCRL